MLPVTWCPTRACGCHHTADGAALLLTALPWRFPPAPDTRRVARQSGLGAVGSWDATHQLRACCHGAVPPGQVALPAPTGPQSRRSTHRHHAQLSVPQQPQPRVVEVLRLQEGWVMGTLCQDPGSRSHRGRGTHSNGTACSVRHLTLLLASQACRAREVFCAAMQRAVATFTSWKTAPTCTLRHQLSQRA